MSSCGIPISGSTQVSSWAYSVRKDPGHVNVTWWLPSSEPADNFYVQPVQVKIRLSAAKLKQDQCCSAFPDQNRTLVERDLPYAELNSTTVALPACALKCKTIITKAILMKNGRKVFAARDDVDVDAKPKIQGKGNK